MALHGGLQGGDAGWALALEIVQEIPDEDAVAPGMTGHPLFAEVEVIDCGLAAKGRDGDGIFGHVGDHVAHGAHEVGVAAAPGGEGGHGEVHGEAALHLQVHHLVVHHVIVAEIDAAAIGSLLDGLADGCFRGMQGEYITGPAGFALGDAGFLAGDVNLLCVIGAAVLGLAAVQAALGARPGRFPVGNDPGSRRRTVGHSSFL